MEKVKLPVFEEGCQDDPAEVACDYPETPLKKIVSTDWAESGSPVVDLVQNFEWTNEDQNLVAKYITADKMSPPPGGRGEVGGRQRRQGRGLAQLS